MIQDELFSVENQVVLVSGGSRGIGRGLASGFFQRGAQVVITGRESQSLQQTADALADGDRRVVTRVCDVSQPDAIVELVSLVVEQFGRIDTLLNVAGVNQRKKAESYTVEEYDFILDINLRGAFLMAQQVGRQMIDQQHGSQIHIDSLNTASPLKGVTPYAMSKAGLNMMTRGLATEWGGHGVRVNALAPGFILTELTEKLWSQPHMQQWGLENTPLGR
ncbi:MAG: SDR family NAD(P)-dependent oxidoreductase, partial [Planctomycetaceae bacterium]